jgi:TetR/AcrR family transcriptional regulator, transcriptional repressor of bet genes
MNDAVHEGTTLRRQELRQAAYEMAGEFGFAVLTVAGIAQHIGLTKGNIHHYFDSKEDLIEQAVRFAHAQFRNAVIERLRKANSPSERLWSVIDGNFAPEIFRANIRRLWLSIFQAAKGSPRLARLLQIVDRRTITHTMNPLRQLVPLSQLETTALGIMALMDGCWFLAVSEPQITRKLALEMIAEHICLNIPAFDRAVLKRIDC